MSGKNERLGSYVETTAGGERARAYLPAPCRRIPH